MPVSTWTNPVAGTLLNAWASAANGTNAIFDIIKTGLNNLELALGAVADNDDATAVAAKMPGISGFRRVVVEPDLDEGALYLMGVEDTVIVNVALADDFGRAPYWWLQNAGGDGTNDRRSVYRNILGLPNWQVDIYGNERRNGRCTFVWDGPPGNMLTFADACQEVFEGARSATLGTWQPAAGSCTLALHSEDAGATTPAGSFSSIRATATGATVFAVTSTGVLGYPATAGVTYSAVGGVRRNGATARDAQMGLQFFGSGGAFISQAYGGTTATTQDEWVTPDSGGLVAPGGTAYMSPIYQVASAAAETFDLAAVALYAGTETAFAPPFVGSGTYGTWGEAAAGDGWVRQSTGEAWVCTTGGVPWLQVWEQVAVRLSTSNALALGSAGPGTSVLPARYDHVHPTTGLILTSALTSTTPAATAAAGAAGASTDVARVDHVHASPQLSDTDPVALGAAAEGVATASSRQDHVHPTTGLLLTSALSSATPAELTATGAAGSSSDVSRADHAHPRVNSRFTWGIHASGSASTFQTLACPAPTLTNATGGGADTTAGNMALFTTPATTGTVGGVNSPNYTHCRLQHAPEYWARIVSDNTAVTDTRYVGGLVSADRSGGAGPAASGASAATGLYLRYDAGIDGTAFWRAVSCDGANATVTTTAASIGGGAVNYELRVEVNAALNSVTYYVDNTLVATHTTNIPSAGTQLGYQATVTTLANAAKQIRVSRITVTQD